MQLLTNNLGAHDVANRNQSAIFWTVSFFGWCALVTVTASSIFAFELTSFLLALVMALTFWAPYGVAAPFVIWIARRFPLNRTSWRSNIWVHLLAALGFVVVCEISFAGLIQVSEPLVSTALAERRAHGENITHEPPPLSKLRRSAGNGDFAVVTTALRLIVFKMQFSLPLYWVLVGIAHAVGAMATLREREQQAAQLAAHLTQAQLAGLRTQLQPHFLFNTLNSITALIPQNAKLATEMVMNLSDLLRMTLREPQRGEIQLSEELALLQYYVDIQRLRFGERLEFHAEASEEARSSSVPPLLLQPLVENAIRHGVEASDQAERITVHAQIEGDELLIEVVNTGTASVEDRRPSSKSTGLGLANTQARLKAHFGEHQYFEAGPRAQGGFRVAVRIPARTPVDATNRHDR